VIDQQHGLTVFASWKLEDGSRIHAARLHLSADAEERSLPELPTSELTRADSFAFELDRRRFVITRAGLRRFLSHYLGVPASLVELTCHGEGKPTLAEQFAVSGLRFNVSHTADIVVYAFAWDREIGIDVEELRPLSNAESIAERFFSSEERSAFNALAPENRTVGFFRCWTRKEAIAKAIGTGLSAALEEFDVSLVTEKSGPFVHVRHPNGERSGWHLHEFQLEPAVIGSCVVSASTILAQPTISLDTLGSTELALCSSDRDWR
jgi:4'-phosphopantetheinyl transferase